MISDKLSTAVPVLLTEGRDSVLLLDCTVESGHPGKAPDVVMRDNAMAAAGHSSGELEGVEKLSEETYVDNAVQLKAIAAGDAQPCLNQSIQFQVDTAAKTAPDLFNPLAEVPSAACGFSANGRSLHLARTAGLLEQDDSKVSFASQASDAYVSKLSVCSQASRTPMQYDESPAWQVAAIGGSHLGDICPARATRAENASDGYETSTQVDSHTRDLAGSSASFRSPGTQLSAIGSRRTFTIGSVGSLPCALPASPRLLQTLPEVRSPARGLPCSLALVRALPAEPTSCRAGSTAPPKQTETDGSPAATKRGYLSPSRVHPNVRFPPGARLTHPLQDHDYCYDVYCKLVVSSKSLLPNRGRQRKRSRKGIACNRPCLHRGRVGDKHFAALEKCVPRLKRKYERRKPKAADLGEAECHEEISVAAAEDYKLPKSRSALLRRSFRDEFVYFGGTHPKSRTRNLDRKENEEPPPQPFYSSQAFYWSGVSVVAPAPCQTSGEATYAPCSAAGRGDVCTALSTVTSAAEQPHASGDTSHHVMSSEDIGTMWSSLGISDDESHFIESVMAVEAGESGTESTYSKDTVSTDPGVTDLGVAGKRPITAEAQSASAHDINDLLSSMTEAEITEVVHALEVNLGSCSAADSGANSNHNHCNSEAVPTTAFVHGDVLSTPNDVAIPEASCSEPDIVDAPSSLLLDDHPVFSFSRRMEEAVDDPCSSEGNCQDASSWKMAGDDSWAFTLDEFKTAPGAALGHPPTSTSSGSQLLLPNTVQAATVASTVGMPFAGVCSTSPQVVPLQMFWNTFPSLNIDGQRYVRLVDIHRQALPSKDTGLLKRRAAALGFRVDNCSELQRNLLVRYAFASPSRSTLIVDEHAAEAVIASYLEPQGLRMMTAAAKKAIEVASVESKTDVASGEVSAATCNAASAGRQSSASSQPLATEMPAGDHGSSSSSCHTATTGSSRSCIVAVMPRRGRPPIRRVEQCEADETKPATLPSQRHSRRDHTVLAKSGRKKLPAVSADLCLSEATIRKQRLQPLASEPGTSVCLLPRAQRLRQVKTSYRRFLNLRHSDADSANTEETLSDRGYQSGDSSPVFIPSSSSAPTPCSMVPDDQAEPFTMTMVNSHVHGAVTLSAVPQSGRDSLVAEQTSASCSSDCKASDRNQIAQSWPPYIDLVCGCQSSCDHSFSFIHEGRLSLPLHHARESKCLQCTTCRLYMSPSSFVQHRHSADDFVVVRSHDCCSLCELRPKLSSVPDVLAIWQAIIPQLVAMAVPLSPESCVAISPARRSCRAHRDKQLHPIEVYDYVWAKRRRTTSSDGDGVVLPCGQPRSRQRARHCSGRQRQH